MCKYIHAAGLFIFYLYTASAGAVVVTVDFEGVVSDTGANLSLLPYTEDGMRVSTTAADTLAGPPVAAFSAEVLRARTRMAPPYSAGVDWRRHARVRMQLVSAGPTAPVSTSFRSMPLI